MICSRVTPALSSEGSWALRGAYVGAIADEIVMHRTVGSDRLFNTAS
jgi:hypothetical protein